MTHPWGRFAWVTLACLIAACGRPGGQSPSPGASTEGAGGQPAVPTLQELQNATYGGLEGIATPIRLENGRWEGEPFAAGGSSRPAVQFMRDFHLVGDLNGDSVSAILLAGGSGGTGDQIHLAVVARRGAELINVATTRLGDRVQVRAARLEAGQIVLDVVQAGPNDAMCCPGDLATRTWELHGTVLRELPSTTPPQRLSLATLSGTEWVLRWWSWTEPTPWAIEVTLRFVDRQIGVTSGCNRCFAPVTQGAMIGDVRVGEAHCREGCPEWLANVEGRFLHQLEGVKKFGFVATQLALTYERDGAMGVMLFSGRPPPE